MYAQIQPSKGGLRYTNPVCKYKTLVTLAKTIFVVMEVPRSERRVILGKPVCAKDEFSYLVFLSLQTFALPDTWGRQRSHTVLCCGLWASALKWGC